MKTCGTTRHQADEASARRRRSAERSLDQQQGLAELDRLRVRAAEFNDIALRGLSAAEQANLLMLLQRVRHNLETIEDAEPAAEAARAARES